MSESTNNQAEDQKKAIKNNVNPFLSPTGIEAATAAATAAAPESSAQALDSGVNLNKEPSELEKSSYPDQDNPYDTSKGYTGITRFALHHEKSAGEIDGKITPKIEVSRAPGSQDFSYRVSGRQLAKLSDDPEGMRELGKNIIDKAVEDAAKMEKDSINLNLHGNKPFMNAMIARVEQYQEAGINISWQPGNLTDKHMSKDDRGMYNDYSKGKKGEAKAISEKLEGLKTNNGTINVEGNLKSLLKKEEKSTLNVDNNNKRLNSESNLHNPMNKTAGSDLNVDNKEGKGMLKRSKSESSLPSKTKPG